MRRLDGYQRCKSQPFLYQPHPHNNNIKIHPASRAVLQLQQPRLNPSLAQQWQQQNQALFVTLHSSPLPPPPHRHGRYFPDWWHLSGNGFLASPYRPTRLHTSHTLMVRCSRQGPTRSGFTWTKANLRHILTHEL